MKKITTISISIIVLLIVIFQACKDEELPKPKNTQTNKIELTITEDSTSYVFSELTCSLNQQANFEIKQYGFCRDTVANVNIKNTNNSFENLISQNFTKNVEVLLPNKTYYVKAYIQTGNVIIYSNEITIQTLDARPIVTTRNITNIIANSALSGGESEAYDTLFPITQRGVCWAKTTKPTIKDSLTTDSTGNGTFTSQIKNLNIGTKYYIRAYAINSEGITYGEEKSFETLDGIPNLTTDSIADVTPTSATFYGNIIENDGLEILEKGFCRNTSTNPTIDNNIVKIPGDTLGSFSKNITNLDVNTTYYVKAYIKNKVGTFYGDEISFTTTDGLPTLTTTTATNITATTATSGGNITDDGGFAITARGVCWSTSTYPTITDAHTTDGSGTGSFTSSLTDLSASTTYYVRAYATNSIGTTYGDEINFITWFTSVTDYDKNIYKGVLIGTQIWMAENIKTTHYADGTAIPLVTDNTAWDNLANNNTDDAYCYYNNNANNESDTYGALYTWAAAMGDNAVSSSANPSGVQGVCPTGWHLPSDAEWTELSNYLGGTSVAGGKMKEIGTEHWYSPNTGATNVSGFTALPGGLRFDIGTFDNLGNLASFWTATEYYSHSAWSPTLTYSYSKVYNASGNKTYGLSVRCIKDN